MFELNNTDKHLHFIDIIIDICKPIPLRMNHYHPRQDFVLLNVGFARHNADWNWKNVQSPFARIHYVKKGRAKIVRSDGMYELREGYFYLTPPYTKHNYECDSMLELYYIHVYEDTSKRIGLFDRMSLPVEVRAAQYDVQLLERLVELNPERNLTTFDPQKYDNPSGTATHAGLQKNSPPAFSMETEGILYQILARFMEHARYKNEGIQERIATSVHFIQKHINETIDLNELAQKGCMSKDHFIRLFKKEMNCTPGRYILQKKMEAAQLRLLLDQLEIKDIAYGLGFDNVPYFNRVFKQTTGVSPSKYKAMHQRNQ